MKNLTLNKTAITIVRQVLTATWLVTNQSTAFTTTTATTTTSTSITSTPTTLTYNSSNCSQSTTGENGHVLGEHFIREKIFDKYFEW